MSTNTATGDSYSLMRLPPEIISSISNYLVNKDIKALRLVGSSLNASVTLRFPRVFLSLHARDIEVFRAVADHPFRHQVTEIIYDDAQLRRLFPLGRDAQKQRRNSPLYNEGDELEYSGMNDLNPIPHPEGRLPTCPVEEWYREKLEETADDTRRRHSEENPEQPRAIERARKTAAQPGWKVSLDVYQRLYKEQRHAAETNADLEAFRYGIGRFANLRRLTITPAAHGALYTPLYCTPTIRTLPYGLNYLMPRGWPLLEENNVQAPPPWPSCPLQSLAAEEHRMLWRGVVCLIQCLAQQPESVPSELVLDAHMLNTGLNPHMLGQPSADYDNFATVLQQPGLRRLDLPLINGGLDREEWDPLVNGHLRDLLGKASNLEHIRLRADTERGFMPQSALQYPPLRSMLPLETWQNLKHFGLSQLVVNVDDLLSALALLPMTLRTVELTFLCFVGPDSHYRGLFDRMKTQLDWRSRPIGQRPAVAAALPEYLIHPESTRGIWISEEVNEFLYGSGENPIQWHNNAVPPGIGTLKDELDPDWELPNLEREDLIRLGYYKNDP